MGEALVVAGWVLALVVVGALVTGLRITILLVLSVLLFALTPASGYLLVGVWDCLAQSQLTC